MFRFILLQVLATVAKFVKCFRVILITIRRPINCLIIIIFGPPAQSR